jgi:uncharacterized alpha/beta hydrolase family protein
MISRRLITAVAALSVTALSIGPMEPSHASVVGCAPDIGKQIPIVLVHGFGGNPSGWNQMASAIKSALPNAYTYEFNYSAVHYSW